MIYINEQAREFHLQTQNSSYIFTVAKTGHLVTLYYGQRLHHRGEFSSLSHDFNVQLGSTTAYAPEFGPFSLETQRLEVPTYGKGDYREPLLHMMFSEDGTRTADFVYHSHEVLSEKPQLAELPSFRLSDDQCALVIKLHDPIKQVFLTLHYAVFTDSDAITRSMTISNQGSHELILDRVMSACVDFADDEFDVIHLSGKWIAESQLERHQLHKGVFQIDSKKGVSGANHNPFLALARPNCDEQSGECYGFGLVYSGNYQATVEVSPYNQTRVLMGISPFDFSWPLAPKAEFACPEVIMTYSHEGLNGMSQHFHHAIQQHLVNPHWSNKPRPVQVNNWEATYFDFDQSKLVKLANAAKNVGVELFVLDDGWFGARDSDASSLGDFFEHEKKLPQGLKGLSKKIRATGLDFGLWVEPEMISIESELYKKHPEWAVQTPGRTPSQGRNQLVLDMTNPDVVDYLYQQLKSVFERAKVSYVKWDHNRNFSDIFSPTGNITAQGGFAHRYVLGLYQLLNKLTQDFPTVLFESCSSGGNRFDLGMLHYMPQTWTSDNTDAHERTAIQYGASLIYPPSTMSAHVSGRPSHQVLRNTPIETRFNVAAFGNLGYQLDLTKLTKFEKTAVTAQIDFYKQHRALLQFGRFYRIASPFTGNHTIWLVVSPCGNEALLGYYQGLQQSNAGLEKIKLPMLSAEPLYDIISRTQFENVRQYGDLLNEHLPVNIADRGIIHSVIANHYMHTTTPEHYRVYGDQLAGAGLALKSQFMGTEMTDEVRHIGDFGSRIYHFKKK